jgi:transposase-like protein
VLPRYPRLHAKRQAQGKSDNEILGGSKRYVARELYGALAVCGLTYKSGRNGQVANRPIYVAFGVTTGGERGILGLRAGEGISSGWLY